MMPHLMGSANAREKLRLFPDEFTIGVGTARSSQHRQSAVNRRGVRCSRESPAWAGPTGSGMPQLRLVSFSQSLAGPTKPGMPPPHSPVSVTTRFRVPTACRHPLTHPSA